MKKQYVVRFSTKESGWVEIGQYDNLDQAKEEYQQQLDTDEKEGWKDNWTQLIDSEGNVIEEHFGEDY